MDIYPKTYLLPGDYTIFLEEYRKKPDEMWIMKPISGAQGKGIFIVSKLNQLKKWANGPGTAVNKNQNNFMVGAYVISRYVAKPLLIGGKKFDLRMYVLVTSYKPLRVW